jgi:membrane associated rhomboid family serine protease
MVDGITDEERERFAVRLKAVFVALVAASAALITLQAGAGLVALTAATVGGVVVGVVLVWLVFPDRKDLERGDGSRSRRRGRR